MLKIIIAVLASIVIVNIGFFCYVRWLVWRDDRISRIRGTNGL